MDMRPLLTEEDLSELIKVPVGTIASWRSRGVEGPPFVRAGHGIRYRPADVEAWLDARTRRGYREPVEQS